MKQKKGDEVIFDENDREYDQRDLFIVENFFWVFTKESSRRRSITLQRRHYAIKRTVC